MSVTEHPNYATCTGCTQSKGVNKYGRMKRHNRANGYGSWQATVECPGSDRPYAEQNREQWDAGQGRWKEMPIEVEAIWHEDGNEIPFIVEVHSFPDVKAGHKLFSERGMTMHLDLLERNSYANTYRAELRDAEGDVVQTEESVRDDGSLNGLVLRWMEHLAKDTAAAKGGQS